VGPGVSLEWDLMAMETSWANYLVRLCLSYRRWCADVIVKGSR